MDEEKIKKILDDWGFKKYIRHCQQPDKNSYGNEITVVEEWSNESVATFIANEFSKE